eukprot:5152838-Pyramimonas_sp.AAC.1
MHVHIWLCGADRGAKGSMHVQIWLSGADRGTRGSMRMHTWVCGNEPPPTCNGPVHAISCLPCMHSSLYTHVAAPAAWVAHCTRMHTDAPAPPARAPP